MDEKIQQLAISVRDGDGEAIKRLHARLSAPLARFLTRFSGVDGSTGEDLANEALAEAYDLLRSGQYDPSRARFTTFVYSIGRIRALRNLRHRTRNRETAMSDLPESSATAVLQARSTSSDQGFKSDEVEAMLECLTVEDAPFSLSPEERFVIVGLTDGHTLEVLAKKLGRSIATVHARKTRGVQKLRQCLCAKGFNGPSSRSSERTTSTDG